MEFPFRVYIAKECPCGGGLCRIRTSTTQNNRSYYSCPGRMEMHCGYFGWCDEVEPLPPVEFLGVGELPPPVEILGIGELPPPVEIPRIGPNRYPECPCGAGICTLKVLRHGPNAGRQYFACRIKRGHGACNFHQWLDHDEIEIDSCPPPPETP
ncbi:uncharacterized protein LOC110702399 [Chenopodium quinoa]|uniref:uncharacterized protein LOC110702399 n=1 Tax=Chenopodium quinoa TaxID=63459 RepID=UPI000B79143D|nr:uncharacterized protein LOC110702399 [Chenopodium quinoa]